MEKLFVFEGETIKVGREIGNNEIVFEYGVWTDGIGLFCDEAPYCAYRLIPGKKYRVTVEQID